MKNTYLMVIALLTFVSIKAQQEPQKKNAQLNSYSKYLSHGLSNYDDANTKTQWHSNWSSKSFKSTEILSEKGIVWNWDTIIAYDNADINIQRHTQTFDVNGNILIRMEEKWLTTQWGNNWKYTYTYNSAGNMLTKLKEEWLTNQWGNNYKYTYTYDSAGNMLTELKEEWLTNQWGNDWKDSCIYDSSGNMLTKIVEVWLINQWDNYWKFTYTYDSNGNMLSQLREDWLTNQWESNYRYTYTYDSAGNMLTQLREEWLTNQWGNDWINTCTYNTNGNIITKLYKVWDVNQWVNSGKDSCTYDIDGNMLNRLHFNWDMNQWVNYSMNTYTYDVNGNSITGKYETWNMTQWGPSISFYIPLYTNKIELFLVNNIYRYEASYTPFSVTGIVTDKTENNHFSIFPNPANEKITIVTQPPVKESSVMISNINGQILVKQPIIDSKTEINVSNLLSGVYFVKVVNSKTAEVKKIIIN